MILNSPGVHCAYQSVSKGFKQPVSMEGGRTRVFLIMKVWWLYSLYLVLKYMLRHVLEKGIIEAQIMLNLGRLGTVA